MAKIALLIVLGVVVVYGMKGFSAPGQSRQKGRRVRRPWRNASAAEKLFARVLAAIAFLALVALLGQ